MYSQNSVWFSEANEGFASLLGKTGALVREL